MLGLTQLSPFGPSQLEGATRLAVAALIGLAAGTEREWSGHASGPQARFAGVRTFFLFGLLGGGAGLLVAAGHAALGTVLAAGGLLFATAAYYVAVRRPDAEPDGTTEGAAMVVLMLGVLAGLGMTALAAGAAAVVVLALGEKARLHGLVARIGEREMRAALQFGVLALVILPLLPAGPYGPLGGLKPRELWTIVVVFSALNFAGYLARRAVGAERGYAATGLLGGVVSSTVVTLQFARLSRREPGNGRALAMGVVGACTVLTFRVAAITALLNRDVAVALLPYLAPPALIGAAVIALALRRPSASSEAEPEPHNPLGLRSALQMAVLFQAAMWLVTAVRASWGAIGVVATGVALGLTNVDALTVSMTRAIDDGTSAQLAALGIGAGVLANTVFKLALGLVLGAPEFRRALAPGVTALAAGSVAGLWLAAVVR